MSHPLAQETLLEKPIVVVRAEWAKPAAGQTRRG